MKSPLASREGDFMVTEGIIEGKVHLVLYRVMRELPRRLWHIFVGLSLPIAGLLVPKDIFLPLLISVTIIFLIFELVRLKFSWLNWRFLTDFRALLRERGGFHTYRQ